MASISKLPNGKWRARYRDVNGKEHARHFDKKASGQRWLDEVVAAQVAGTYVDPTAGKVTFQEYAEAWRKLKTHGTSTSQRIESQLRVHVYPSIGHMPIGKIRKPHLQGWLLGMRLAESTKNIALGTVKSIFNDAVSERVIASNPAADLKLPSRASAQDMWIPSWKQVNAIRGELPSMYKAVVDVVVGSGLRQGEFLGLEVDCIDFLKDKTITVRQQRQQRPSPMHISLPKTAHSRRSVPVADVTLEALAEHIRNFGRTIQVYDGNNPLFKRGGDLTELKRDARILFPWKGASGNYGLMWANDWRRMWNGAATAAGWPVSGGRAGVHCLRHFYASGLIRYGESVTTVCRRLGHANPNVTLAIYAHLWPDSDQTTRQAVMAMYAQQDEESEEKAQ